MFTELEDMLSVRLNACHCPVKKRNHVTPTLKILSIVVAAA
jgi:hypothetical protein